MIRRLALLHLWLLSGTGLWFGLGQDHLLAKSSFVETLAFTVGMSLALWLPLAILGLFFPLRLAPPRRATLEHTLAVLCLTNLLFGGAAFALDAVFASESAVLSLLVGSVLFALCLFLVLRLPERAGAERSIGHLALAFWTASLLFTGGLAAQNRLLFQDGVVKAAAPPKNFIFLLIDAMGQDFLSPYNPAADTPDFEELARGGLLYTHMYTNHPFTNGYFEVLYSGHKAGAPRERHLWQLLQEAGVTTRWLAYHNNGVPDTHELAYRGLRSAFLTQNFNFIPAWLGLDYNIFRYRGFRSRGTPMGERELWLTYLSNLPFRGSKILEEDLIREVEELRGRERPFFFLIHAEKSPGMEKWKWWKPKWAFVPPAYAADPNLEDELEERLEGNDNLYAPEWQPLVDQHRQNRAEEIIPTALQSLKRVFEIYRERGWDRDTVLLVTADHGYMFRNRRYAYHYHVDEEAIRVPLLVTGPGLTGKDDRLFETIDLTQTILSYFGVEERLSADAVSILDPAAQKTLVTSLAKDAEHRGEWLLAVRTPDTKYVLDLLGEHTPQRYRVEGFDSIPNAGPADSPPPFDLEAILQDYGVKQNTAKRQRFNSRTE